nr:uncharacterized LOC107803974 [Ipomoea batatas]
MGKVKLGAPSKNSITHFSHPHPLELITTPSSSSSSLLSSHSCSACKLQLLSGSPFYACKACNFSLHSDCFKLHKEITHPFHSHHFFTLLPQTPYPSGRFTCDACGEQSDGFSYRCSPCGLDLHVQCAVLPLSITHRSHHHPLQIIFPSVHSRMEVFSCDVCKGLGQGKFWKYRCHSCDFDAHLNCTKMLLSQSSQQGQTTVNASASRVSPPPPLPRPNLGFRPQVPQQFNRPNLQNLMTPNVNLQGMNNGGRQNFEELVRAYVENYSRLYREQQAAMGGDFLQALNGGGGVNGGGDEYLRLLNGGGSGGGGGGLDFLQLLNAAGGSGGAGGLDYLQAFAGGGGGGGGGAAALLQALMGGGGGAGGVTIPTPFTSQILTNFCHVLPAPLRLNQPQFTLVPNATSVSIKNASKCLGNSHTLSTQPTFCPSCPCLPTPKAYSAATPVGNEAMDSPTTASPVALISTRYAPRCQRSSPTRPTPTSLASRSRPLIRGTASPVICAEGWGPRTGSTTALPANPMARNSPVRPPGIEMAHFRPVRPAGNLGNALMNSLVNGLASGASQAATQALIQGITGDQGASGENSGGMDGENANFSY